MDKRERKAKGEIIGAIRIYRDEMRLSPTEIVEKIMAMFALDRDVAEQYVEDVLGALAV